MSVKFPLSKKSSQDFLRRGGETIPVSFWAFLCVERQDGENFFRRLGWHNDEFVELSRSALPWRRTARS